MDNIVPKDYRTAEVIDIQLKFLREQQCAMNQCYVKMDMDYEEGLLEEYEFGFCKSNTYTHKNMRKKG